jgi:hypothetical protein
MKTEPCKCKSTGGKSSRQRAEEAIARSKERGTKQAGGKCNGQARLRSKDLLGCPFCGELPEYKPWAQGHAPEYHWPHQIVHDCKIIGEQICIRAHTAGLRDTKESVFKIWNTRTAGHPNESSSPTAGGGSGGAQPKGTNEKEH